MPNARIIACDLAPMGNTLTIAVSVDEGPPDGRVIYRAHLQADEGFRALPPDQKRAQVIAAVRAARAEARAVPRLVGLDFTV